eukprot:748680-Hanusia_phi.AAC.1
MPAMIAWVVRVVPGPGPLCGPVPGRCQECRRYVSQGPRLTHWAAVTAVSVIRLVPVISLTSGVSTQCSGCQPVTFEPSTSPTVR